MERHTQGGDASVEARRPEFDGKKADNPHRGRRQGDPCDLRQRRQVFAMRGLPLQVWAGGQRRSVVPKMPPVPPLASPDERPHGAKARLRTSGSPRERQTRLKAPFPGPQRPLSGLSAPGWTLKYPSTLPNPQKAHIAYFGVRVAMERNPGVKTHLERRRTGAITAPRRWTP